MALGYQPKSTPAKQNQFGLSAATLRAKWPWINKAIKIISKEFPLKDFSGNLREFEQKTISFGRILPLNKRKGSAEAASGDGAGSSHAILPERSRESSESPERDIIDDNEVNISYFKIYFNIFLWGLR